MDIRRQLGGLLLLVAVSLPAAAQGTRLLRRPTVSRDMVAFEYGGDLWVASRSGGVARRLTATPSIETDPVFSPDGSQIAYTATVAGNTDVYTVPTAGGASKRLTFHPGVDYVRGWTPDGRRIVFASSRGTVPTPGANAFFRLWTISAQGGMPELLPMPRAFTGSYAPDAKRMAYQELGVAMFAAAWAEPQNSQWRRYRGGRTQPIRLMNLADYSEEKLPGNGSNDTDPMWVGNTVYFLSDRDNTVNLYAYNLDNRQLTQITHHSDFDIMSASAGPDAIAYEQAGYIHLVNLQTGQAQQLDIDVRGDFPWAEPQMKKVASLIGSAAISPTGVRAAFEARGDIFTIAAKDNSYRDITHSSGAHERGPAWSPDGTQIAWLSDASGEYQLMIGDQAGETAPRAIALPSSQFFSDLEWSPDGQHLLLADNDVNLWLLDVKSGRFTKIDTDTYHDPGRGFDASWSPDSRWVSYSKSLDSHMRAIFLYSLGGAKTYQLSDGMADAITPAFDAGGKYLYFLASTDYALQAGWLDMSSQQQVVRRSIYLAVLSAGVPSPLLPEAENEPAHMPDTGQHVSEARPAAGHAPPPPALDRTPSARADSTAAMHVDLDGIQERIVALPGPPGDYGDLIAGSAGTFFYTEAARAGPGGARRLWEYQIADRGAKSFLEGIDAYLVSADRKKLLYQAAGNHWGIVPTDHPAKVGDGNLDVDQLETVIDPRAEWAEIFRESWRTERQFFYDPKMQGNNWQAIYDKYSPMVPYVEHRADLGYLIAQVGGELTVGHSYLGGEGDVPDTAHVSVGLLGADYTEANGYHRIAHIYTAGAWNPQLHAPLSAPGLRVAEGDYILEVNGRPLSASTNFYSLFVGTAGKHTTIRVNSAPAVAGSWLVTVVPVPDDEGLRTEAWIDNNRRLVDKLSGGRLAYVWLPNTAGAGYTAFRRYFYPQQAKDGAIIDERYNQGGEIANYIVDQLDRVFVGYFARRAGHTITVPMMGMPGPKVLVINESAGSGGDALPYYFRAAKIGPLVGTRTWGGLVGTLGVPSVIDGGGITVPDLAFYNQQGKWAIENEGITPDVEVANTPADVIKGHDPQLERAVAEALKLLQAHPVERTPRPPPINRVTVPASY